MNVRLFVSSVFTDCQRDLLDALQAPGGRRGRQLLYTLPLLLHSHLHIHTHTQAHSHMHCACTHVLLRAHTHARTLAYAERQKLLHTLRKLTAFPFLARMQNNRIATSRALLRPTSPLLTSPCPYPYRTVPLRTIPFRIAPLLSPSLSPPRPVQKFYILVLHITTWNDFISVLPYNIIYTLATDCYCFAVTLDSFRVVFLDLV